jgi:Na+/H+ antiporter NhaD/arsenite permease-like protein
MSVAFGLLNIDEVVEAIDLDVILFLIGMFSLASLANLSGLLEAIAYCLLRSLRVAWG